MSGLLIGRKGVNIKKLQDKLNDKFDVDFRITIAAPDISENEIKTFFQKEVKRIICEKFRLKDHLIKDLSIQSIIDKSSCEILSRDIVAHCNDLRIFLRGHRSHHIEGLEHSIYQALLNRFGKPINFAVKAIHLSPDEVKNELLELFEVRGINESDLLDIYVNNLDGITGREIIIYTENVPKIVKIISDVNELLISKFGWPFSISFKTNADSIDSEVIESRVLQLIQTETETDYILQKVVVEPLDGVDGRKIMVYGDPANALIGKNGSISNRIRESLLSDFGGPIEFLSWSSALEPNVVRTVVQSYLDEFISNNESQIAIGNISIKSFNQSLGRKVIITCDTPSILIGKSGKKLQEIYSRLGENFPGNFLVEITQKSTNLDSGVVRNFIKNFIDSRINSVWDVETEFEIKNIDIGSYDGFSGREINIFCTKAKNLIGPKGVRARQMESALGEEFGKPFRINFLSGEPDLDYREVMNYIKICLDNESIICSGIRLSDLDGSKNRKILLSTEHRFETDTIDEFIDNLKSEFGGNFLFTFAKPVE